MAQFICENLSIGYGGKVVLDNINFKIDRGDYLCIVGENGSGKSTLMKTILGLQSEIGGKIIIDDEISKSHIGYLPQQTDIQKDFPASVKEVVLSGFEGKCGLRPFYTKTEKLMAKEAMKKINIENLAKKSYRELSGGQQQRVLLARALCATEKIILLDEPVSGLDPKSTAELYEIIEDLNKSGTTIIMISHDILVAVKHASHILHLGENIFYGTKKEYLQSEIGSKFTSIERGE